MRRWDGLVDRYLMECETRGLAPATLSGRQRELERFGSWIRRRRPRPRLEDIAAEHIAGYVSSRSAFRARSSVAGVVSILRCMGDFLVRAGIWHTSPLRWMRGPKIDSLAKIPKRVSRAQLDALWSAATRRRSEYGRYQAICALAILYATGLRRGELERLELGDWNREAGVLTIDGRKTGRVRHVPVGQAAWRCIEAYLPHRHNLLEKHGCTDETALLLNRNGRRLAAPHITTLVKSLAKRAGVEHVTLHAFRHSCATDLLDRGVSLPDIQQLLGHCCLETTVRYARVVDPQRAEAIELHPINEFLADREAA